MKSEIDDTGFKTRLERLIGEEKPFVWAAKVGLSAATFSRMWKDGIAPKADSLVRISEATGSSIDWLLKGDEHVERHKPHCHSNSGKEVPHWENRDLEISGIFPDEYALVPRYDVEVSAGHGSLIEEDSQPIESLAFRRVWLKRMGLVAAKLALVTAKGDSMEPTLADGDLLLIDLRQTSIVDGAIHVLRNNGNVLVKRLQRGLGDQIIVTSDNTIYRELETTADQLNVVGRVIWRGGRM